MKRDKKGKVLVFGLVLMVLLVLAPAAGMAPVAVAAQGVTVQVADHPELGKILTDGAGMTLYLFTRDGDRVSNCYDQCATNWPPLLVDAGQAPAAGPGLTGQLGTIERSDGSQQVTYNGMPLYYWIADQNPGDASGQNVGNVWFVVHPDISTMTVDSPLVQVTANPTYGNILTSQGMTLYLFEKDEQNVTNCYDQCAVNWPPLLADGGTPQAGEGLQGTLGLIDRTDGTQQVTYNGVPLYFWIGDARPSDTNGQEVGDVWYVVDASGAAVEEAMEAQATATVEPTATPAAGAGAAPVAEASQDQPTTLPQTGGRMPPWGIVAAVIAALALVVGGLGVFVVRRFR